MEKEMVPIYDNITAVVDYLQNLFDKDNLVDQWFLVKTPYPSLIVLLMYFLFVLKIGPQFMKDRRPFNLNNVMRVYNVFQVMGNIRLIYYPIFVYNKYLPYIAQMGCVIPKETDENVDELKRVFLYLFYGYFELKILDLLDTVFMVLRKKNSHVTFLHVYHHGVMVFGSWYTLKHLKSLQSILPGLINVIVHIVMYSYYFLATFGEPIKKYLWWKKHLTKLQLGQFAVIMMYISALYYYGCPVSKTFTYFWLFNVFVIFCLFVNFYIRAYVMSPKTIKTEKRLKKKD